MLPKNEKTFHVSIIGETTDERYEGDFTCLCVPFVGLRNKIARDEIRETGDMDNITSDLFLRARWLANVQNRLLTWPDWWAGVNFGSKLLDDNVLKEVYDKCIEAEIEWRTSIKNKTTQTTPATPEA